MDYFADSKTSLFTQSGTQGIPMIGINVLSETRNESDHAKATVIRTGYMELERLWVGHFIDARLHSPAGHVRWREDLHLCQD